MEKHATEIAVRRLSENDVDDFRALLDIFAAAFDGETSDRSKTPGREYLERLLTNSSFIALAGKVDGTVVGGLTGHELPKSDEEASEIYIYDLAVAPSHRRLGIATRLILEVQKVAMQRGSTAIFVQADPADLPAVALYEGIAERSDVLHFDIPMGGWKA